MGTIFKIKELVKAKKDIFIQLSDYIWENPELFFKEEKALQAQLKILQNEGFEIKSDICGIKTAFMASYGSDGPIIAFLGEYDALPALSQEARLPEKKELVTGGPGHGCGHNALGSGAIAAAVAVKDYLLANGLPGKVRYYGCPAEEAGWAKMFMARDGVFDDVDAAITWHPSFLNTVQGSATLANLCAYFTFTGQTSHAAASPHLGRSALDACELMSVGVNYLREHIIPEARVHYAYQDAGGEAPNVVQEHACVKYFIRAPRIQEALEIRERVSDIARGAALMTGTEVKIDFTSGMCDYVPNTIISKVLSAALEEHGGPEFDAADFSLAEKFYHICTESEKENALQRIESIYENGRRFCDEPLLTEVAPFRLTPMIGAGSSDVGDVSQTVPTATLLLACVANGTPYHSWKFTAQGCSSIMHKGIVTAAEVMSLAAVRLLAEPELLQKAKGEYVQSTGGKYICPVGPEARPGF